MGDLRVRDIGEFALIDRLAEALGPVGLGAGYGVIRGIGDDAAVLQQTPGTRLLASCDMLVEGLHFDLSYFNPRQLGWKALAANLSDIAAMGGRPRWALVSLGLKPDMMVNFVEEIYAGIAELAMEHSVVVVGGDTCSSPERLIIDICILGEAYRTKVAYRSGAQDGDMILVTGWLGSSAAGLACLRDEKGAAVSGREELLQAHLTPVPRVKEAAYLMNSGLVGAMNDISDGLATELHEITQASGCGARIWADRLPLSPAVRDAAGQLGVDPLEWALYGGEDYELLVTATGGKNSPLKLRRLSRSLKTGTGIFLSAIGRIVSPPGVEIVYPGERVETLPPAGYNHFKRGS